MQKIESASNPIIKQTKKLLTASGRKKLGMFILEGERLVRDAINCGADVDYALVSQSFGDAPFLSSVNSYQIPDKLFDELKSTVNSQGVMAVARYSFSDFEQIDTMRGLYLYLDCISDPGNLGTIIRSANAFGADGIILSRGCTDAFSPKVLRSTMSGIFTQKLYIDTGDAIGYLSKNGFDILGTFPGATDSSHTFKYGEKCVIVMGNEANGISDEVTELCTHKITIPMTNDAESLNVSVACGIILYEAFVSRNK